MKKLDEPARQPRWETFVLAGSFILLWAWWLAKQAAVRNGALLSPVWTAVLIAAVVLLLVVFVRRTKRVIEGLRAGHPAKRFPDRN